MEKKNPADCSEIFKRFTYHAPKGDQPKRYEEIREAAKTFAIMLANYCPNSREKSLALTKLEEVVMWSNAAIARNETDADIANRLDNPSWLNEVPPGNYQE